MGIYLSIKSFKISLCCPREGEGEYFSIFETENLIGLAIVGMIPRDSSSILYI